MKALYLEPFAGVSGNMLLGALLHVGVPFDYLQQELAKLRLGDYELINKKVDKNGIRAFYFNVVTEEASGHGHHYGHHEHNHKHDKYECEHYLHNHEYCYGETIYGAEHHLDCDYNYGAEHHEHQAESSHVHRRLHDIEMILDGSDLNTDVIAKAKTVFRAIAEAEAKVHGTIVEEIHFHEVGAIDTIIDIVGNIVALQYLGVKRVFTTPVNTGFGMVRCAHGLMPVPAPATAELLQGLPQYRGSVAEEMTTPTGAALLKVLAEPVTEVPAGFSGGIIGYGAGTRDVKIPNVLRVTLGEYTEVVSENDSSSFKTVAAGKNAVMEGAVSISGAEGTAAGQRVEDILTVLECNLDDLSPEILPYVLDRLLATGALDAWLQPVIMKKGRPGHLVSVLCDEAKRVELAQVLFKETTTLGVRAYQVARTSLERRWQTVTTPWGQVRVKEGRSGGTVVNQAPEFEDCKQLAEVHHVPLKKVAAAAVRAIKNKE